MHIRVLILTRVLNEQTIGIGMATPLTRGFVHLVRYSKIHMPRIMSLISSLIRRIHASSMKGLCIIADMGSFYLLNRIEELVDYGCFYGSKFDKRVNVKAFCCHHRQEIKKALTEEQQSRIFSHHNRNLLLTSS